MITITIHKNHINNSTIEYTYNANGHSKNNNVCGAITILQYTFVKIANIDYEAPETGVWKITFKSTCVNSDFLSFFMCGLKSIANEYPNEVTITEVKWGCIESI